MTVETLHDAITLLPGDLIAEADKKRTAPKAPVRWQRYAAMAACFALVTCASLWCVQLLSPRKTTESCTAEAPAVMQETAAANDAAAAAAPAAAEAAPKEECAPEEQVGGGIQDSASGESSGTGCYGTTVPQVTVSGDFEPRELSSEERVTLARLLSELEYRPEDICECIAEITVTVNGEDRFFINLDEGFVRGPQGQAQLTQAQIDTLREIFYPVEEE